MNYKCITPATGCNDDEAIHLEADRQLFHICLSDPMSVFMVQEIICPHCGEHIPANTIEEHIENELWWFGCKLVYHPSTDQWAVACRACENGIWYYRAGEYPTLKDEVMEAINEHFEEFGCE